MVKIVLQHAGLVKPLPKEIGLTFRYNNKTTIFVMDSYEDLVLLSRFLYNSKDLELVPQIFNNRYEYMLYKAITSGFLPLTLSYYYSIKTDDIVYIKFDMDGDIVEVKTQIAHAKHYVKRGIIFISKTSNNLLKKLAEVMKPL